MTPEEIQAISALISVILLAIQGYLVYRVDQTKLALETRMGFSEKFKLIVESEIDKYQNEKLLLTNKGTLPIDEIEAKFTITKITDALRNEADVDFCAKWLRKSILNPEEKTVIPLNNKLFAFLKTQNLVEYEEFPFMTSHPETGEDVEDNLLIPNLIRPFSTTLEVEINSKIQNHTKTVVKKFILIYSFTLPDDQYSANYEVITYAHEGDWTD